MDVSEFHTELLGRLITFQWEYDLSSPRATLGRGMLKPLRKNVAQITMGKGYVETDVVPIAVHFWRVAYFEHRLEPEKCFVGAVWVRAAQVSA